MRTFIMLLLIGTLVGSLIYAPELKTELAKLTDSSDEPDEIKEARKHLKTLRQLKDILKELPNQGVQ